MGDLSSRTICRLSCSILCVVAFGMLAAATAAGDDAQTLGRDADKELRAAQRAMFGGKLDEAQQSLDKAAELIEKLKAAAPDDRRLKALTSKLERTRRDVEKRRGKAGGGETATGKTPAAADKDAPKLPGGVTFRLKKVDAILARGDDALTKKTTVSNDWKVKTLEAIVTEADEMMTDIRNRYGRTIPATNDELKTRETKIATFRQKVKEFKGEVGDKAAADAKLKAEREKQSAEWLARLKPYVTGRGDPGYDEDKYLIASGTSNVEELMRRKAIHGQASALMDKYRKTEFRAGKTDELTTTEEELAGGLKRFEEGFKSTTDGFVKDADKELTRSAAWLAAEEKKKDPNLLSQFVIQGLRKKVEAASGALPANDERVVALKKQLAEVEERAGALRKRHVGRTVMQPDRFKGEERGALVEKAAEILKAKHADAKLLRTAVISAEWQQETKIEWTDTTRTAVRKRTTRSVSVQIAANRGDQTSLFTLYVARNLQPDGKWGALYGHIMFTDPMLEENVKR